MVTRMSVSLQGFGKKEGVPEAKGIALGQVDIKLTKKIIGFCSIKLKIS